MKPDTHEIALTAIYLAKGYAEAEKKAPGKNMLANGGQIETMGELVSLAEIQEQWFLDRGYEGTGCPGVYAYDFAEPMGAWLYGLDGLPNASEFIAELDRRWAEWVGPDFTYEVQPCVDEGGLTAPCSEAEADYWGVYERPKKPDAQGNHLGTWVADFARKEDAEVFKKLMEDSWK